MKQHFNIKPLKRRLWPESRWYLSDKCLNTDNQRSSCILFAASRGNATEVAELIAAKANVNARSEDGSTPLMLAVCGGYIDVVKKLIAAGANVNLQNMDGLTALMMAARSTHVSIIDELLRVKNIDVNQTDTEGKTALIITIDRKDKIFRRKEKNFISDIQQTDIAKKLIEAGADINIQDENGITALMLAVKYSYSELVIELLERGADVSKTDNKGNVALLFAKEMPIIKSLLSKGTDINIQNNDGMTLLMSVVRSDNLEDVKELLALGADPSIKTSDNKTAIMFACASRFNDPEIVKELLVRGVDPNIQDKHGVTPLMCSIHSNSLRDIDLLLSHIDTDVNLKTVDGMTALMYAARTDSEFVERLLKKKNIKVNEQDNDGVTALMIAAGYMSHKVFNQVNEILDETDIGNLDVYAESQLNLVTNLYDGSSIAALLAAGADPNIQDEDGMTALMHAVNADYAGVVKLLLSDGNIDPNIINKEGKTALMLAVSNCNIGIVKLLLSHNDIKDIWDEKGMTALMLASRCGYVEIVDELLKKYGSEYVAYSDIYDKSALIYATQNKHAEIVSLLRTIGVDDTDTHKTCFSDRQIQVPKAFLRQRKVV